MLADLTYVAAYGLIGISAYILATQRVVHLLFVGPAVGCVMASLILRHFDRAPDAEDALIRLRDALPDLIGEDAAALRPEQGCVGCGGWLADVADEYGETWCWSCMDIRRWPAHLYTVIPGRDR
jgi:hypothetical protein